MSSSSYKANTDASCTHTHPKHNRKRIIKFSVLGIVLIVAVLAFGLPFTVSDGTENFTGKEREIAKDAIGDGSYQGMNASPTLDLPVPFRGKVMKVHKQNPEKRCGITSKDEGSVYIVEIDRVTFLGILAPGYDAHSCELDK